VVGILNSTEDVIEILAETMRGEGYEPVAAYIADFKRDRRDMTAWLGQLPSAPILYDLPPPYEENWSFFQAVRDLPAAKRHRFVLTTTNQRILQEFAGPIEAIEFIGRPFDLAEIVRAIDSAYAWLDSHAPEASGVGA
jgi:hypothetical protein